MLTYELQQVLYEFLRKKKGVEKTQRCINLSLFELEMIFQHQFACVIGMQMQFLKMGTALSISLAKPKNKKDN
jgi:hypothetical protein